MPMKAPSGSKGFGIEDPVKRGDDDDAEGDHHHRTGDSPGDGLEFSHPVVVRKLGISPHSHQEQKRDEGGQDLVAALQDIGKHGDRAGEDDRGDLRDPEENIEAQAEKNGSLFRWGQGTSFGVTGIRTVHFAAHGYGETICQEKDKNLQNRTGSSGCSIFEAYNLP